MAVKVLRGVRTDSVLEDGESWTRRVIRRLEYEMNRLQHISHPRIVETLGFAEVGRLPAVITQWCSNGSVKDYISTSFNADRYALVSQIYLMANEMY